MKELRIFLDDNVAPMVSANGDIIIGAVGSIPAPPPVVPPVNPPTGGPPPVNYLDDVYFSEDDLLRDCAVRPVTYRVTINNNGNIRVVWPGASGYTQQYDMTSTGTLRVHESASTTPPPAQPPAQPPATPPAPPTTGSNVTIQPPAGHQQIIIMSGDNWTLMLPNQPAPRTPGHTGFVRIVEIAGNDPDQR